MRRLALLLACTVLAGVLVASGGQPTRLLLGVTTHAVGKPGLHVGTLLKAPTKGPHGQRIIRYQWELCDAAGLGCRKISGATHRTYRVRWWEVHHTIRIRVDVVTSGNGSASITTGASPVIVGPLPVNTVLPTISGVAQVGQLLTGTQGTWTGAVHYTYQWNDCAPPAFTTCTPITGATGLTYTIQQTDLGDEINFTVTAYNY